MEKNKEKKSFKNKPDWKNLYKSEEKKYKKYLKATQISSLTELTQKLSKDFPKTQVLTNY